MYVGLPFSSHSAGPVFLHEVRLMSAQPQRGLGPPAPWVETCLCPQGYTGQFCEFCAPGYKRETPHGSPYTSCIPCTCNHHGTCDPNTGESPESPSPRLPGPCGHSEMRAGPHRWPLGDTGTGLSLPCPLGFFYCNKRPDWYLSTRDYVHLSRPSASLSVGTCPLLPHRPWEGLLRALLPSRCCEKRQRTISTDVDRRKTFRKSHSQQLTGINPEPQAS